MGGFDWERDLAELERATPRTLPRNLPAHVHAVPRPARLAQPVVTPMPQVPPRGAPRPASSGAEPLLSPYPAHVTEAFEPLADPQTQDPRTGVRSAPPARRPQGGRWGEVLDLGALDLTPSYPREVYDADEPSGPVQIPVAVTAPPPAAVPLPGPPPPARTRRDAVRPLATVPAAPALPPTPDPAILRAAPGLIDIFRAAAAHAGQLQALLTAATDQLAAAVAAPASPEPPSEAPAETPRPEVTVESPAA